MRKSTWILTVTLLLSIVPALPPSALAGMELPPDFFELVAVDGAASDRFGVSVAIDGDTVLVGARGANVGGIPNRGVAYVFVRDGDQWVQQAKLTEPDGLPSGFGASVALSGETALIGTGDSSTNKAYVFTRTGTEWAQQAELSGADSEPGDTYGAPVALDGDTAVVGAHTTDIDGTFNQGAVYVFVRDGSTWTEEARLIASDGGSFSLFGRGLAVAGDMVVVGAPFHDLDGNSSQGAGYVFVRDNAQWTEQAQLIASDGVAADNLGEAVAVSATRAVLGAPSAAAVYVFDLIDGEWTEQAILTPSDSAGGNFGDAVALSGDRIVVGALFADSNQGAAYVFELEDGAWVEREKLSASGSAQFGNAVDIDHDAILVGAHQTEINGNFSQGNAYVITPGVATPMLELDPLALDFGNIEVGTTSPTLLSMLHNAGNVEITGLQFTEPGGDFNADTSVCGTALVVGQSCPILVTFEPGQPGPAMATIEITSAETAPLQLELVANGVDGAFPEADIAPEAFNFEVESGNSDSATLTIGNTGTAELTWEIDQVTGAGDCASPGDLPWLGVVPDDGTTLPGNSATVTVSVDATDLVPSEYSALLCVTTNDPNAALVEIPVTVTVIEPVLVEMTFTPSSLDFGDVELGTVSASMIAVLENTGDVELTGLSFGHSGAGFEADGNRCGDTLPVGGSCNVNVAFTPMAAGPADAVLEVTSNQTAGAGLALSGTGFVPARPAIGVDPAALSATLTQGDAGAQPMTIANSGDAVLDWQFAEERTAIRRVGALEMLAHENLDWAAIIDPAGKFAYFPANTDVFARAGVVKIDLESFERVDALILEQDETLPRTAVIDPTGEFAYIGTGMTPGRIVRVNLETFERVDRINLGAGENGLVSAVIDPAGEFAYFATNLLPGRVIKIDLGNFERVGSIALSSGEGRLQAAVIDPAGEFAYFGTDGGHVVKISLDPFEEVDEIVLPSSEIAPASAVIDPSGAFAYFGTSIEPRVVRIDLETFARVDSLTLPVGGQQVRSAVIDPAGEFAYFSTLGHDQMQQDPAWLAKIDLATFEMVDAVDMADGEHVLRSAVIDPAGAFAYFATSVGGASRVVKAALRNDCTLPSWADIDVVGGTVDPGGNQAINVTFDAAGLEPGEYRAALCIGSNDPVNPLAFIPLTLTVEAAPAEPGVLTAEPDTLDFDEVEIGQSSTLDLTVSNAADAGADPLTLESIGLDGDGAFALDGGDCTQGMLLAAQQSCTVTVRFSPLAEQPSTGQVGITSTDGQAVTVGLSGTGVEQPDPPDEVFWDRFEADL